MVAINSRPARESKNAALSKLVDLTPTPTPKRRRVQGKDIVERARDQEIVEETAIQKKRIARKKTSLTVNSGKDVGLANVGTGANITSSLSQASCFPKISEMSPVAIKRKSARKPKEVVATSTEPSISVNLAAKAPKGKPGRKTKVAKDTVADKVVPDISAKKSAAKDVSTKRTSKRENKAPIDAEANSSRRERPCKLAQPSSGKEPAKRKVMSQLGDSVGYGDSSDSDSDCYVDVIGTDEPALEVEDDDANEDGEAVSSDEAPEVTEELKQDLGGLTEGCFILPPVANQSSSIETSLPFRPLLSGREPPEMSEIRYVNYQYVLDKVEQASQDQLFETQKRSFDSILNHLYKQFVTHKERVLETEPQTTGILRPKTSLHSLNLLVVRHGSNRADANPLYDRLMQLLETSQEEVARQFDVRVADVQRTCLNPSIDSITKTLFMDWLSPKSDSNLKVDFSAYKSMTYDLKLLKDWYTQYKANDKQGKQEIFVVLLRDFQLMDTTTLQDLVRILSLYRPALPIWAVLGASASPILLESLLPQDSLAQVTIQTFDLVDPHRAFMDILEQIFIRHNTTKLNANTFQLLFNTFDEFTHSITTFLKSLKYSIMDHFYSNPLSVLHCPDDISPIVHLESLKLQHEHCELIRMMPSFQSHINSQVAKGLSSSVRSALVDDKYLLTTLVPNMLSRIHAYHQAYPQAFQCLMHLQAWVTKHPCPGTRPLRPQLPVALYNANLESHMTKLECFKLVIKAFSNAPAARNLPKVKALLDDLLRIITKANSPLVSGKDIPNPQAWADKLKSFKNSLDQTHLILPPQVLNQLAALLQQFFQDFLPSYRSLPLNEAFYYSKTELLEKTFNPQPQTALEFALTRPRVYLPTPAGRQGGAPPVPDASIAYRLYKEAGRLVNLYDWLKAFEHMVVKLHHKQDPKSPPPTPTNIQARFSQCLNELKFLGYIQATQRKTDHVQKLTWN